MFLRSMTAYAGVILLLMACASPPVSEEKTAAPVAGFQKTLNASTRHWVSDITHSWLTFRLSLWGIVDIVGWIEDFEVRLSATDPDFSEVEITAEFALDSLRMPNSQMAQHARTLALNTKVHPKAYFRSTTVEKSGEETYRLIGDLTLGGLTRSVTLAVVFNGYSSPQFRTTPGFTAKGVISRFDFGMTDDHHNPGNDELTVGAEIEIILSARFAEMEE